VLVDNRFGEANFIPLQLPFDAGMVSDLDGARLRAYLDAKGGRSTIRFNKAFNELNTGRSGIITSFSSAGPTAFGHELKPDLAAPGGQILSSTLPEAAGEPFAVFDGTSMSAPHVTGAVALLLARHPAWTPPEVKSALMSTAGAAWGDTARTQEASVLLEGAGLVNVPRADDPKLFTTPVSLSFDDLDVSNGGARRSMLLEAQDAGGGSGPGRSACRASRRPRARSSTSLVRSPSRLVGRRRFRSSYERTPTHRRATITASSR